METPPALREWFDALNRGDLERLTRMYADDAVLTATFEKSPLLTPEERHRYFENLVRWPEMRADLDLLHLRDHWPFTIAAGLYTFRYRDRGEERAVPARFTMVFRESTGGAAILSHHSSRVPDPFPGRSE